MLTSFRPVPLSSVETIFSVNRNLRQPSPNSCANGLRQPASSLSVQLIVTMRRTPVFMRVLAQFSKLQSPCNPRDGLKTGAFNVPQGPVPGCSSTDRHTGALLFYLTAIKTMIQRCEASIVSSGRTDQIFWNLTRHTPVTA